MANVTFSLQSKQGNNKFTGHLTITHNIKKDRYKLKVEEGTNFQEIKLDLTHNI